MKVNATYDGRSCSVMKAAPMMEADVGERFDGKGH